MACYACVKPIKKNEDFLSCTIGDCNKRYHFLCTGETNPLNVNKETWKCPVCRCAAKKGGDNSLTPVGVSKKQDPNVTIRQKNIPMCPREEPSACEKQNFSQDICDMRLEMAKMREQLSHSATIISTYDTKLTNSISTIANYEAKLNQSITIMAAYEATIKKYAMEMEKLYAGLQKCSECSKVNIGMDPQPEPSAGPQKPSPPLVPQPQPSSGTLPVHCQVPLPVGVKVNKPTKPSMVQKLSKVQPSQPKTNILRHPEPQPATTSTTQGALSKGLNVNNITGKEEVIAEGTEKGAQPWVEVKKKQNRRLTSMCGTAGPAVTSLKAMEERKYLHLWNMASGIEEVREYLLQLCSGVACTVHELTPRGDYKSYKIGVPVAYYDVCFCMDVWPVNARIKAWINYRMQDQSVSALLAGEIATKPTSNRPFRGRPSDGAAT